MSKRTKKVGITGKYGTRYGGALRKIARKYEISSHAKYICGFCGKKGLKKQAVGIWKCKFCGKTVAGGAWVPTTGNAQNVKSTLVRLTKLADEAY